MVYSQISVLFGFELFDTCIVAVHRHTRPANIYGLAVTVVLTEVISTKIPKSPMPMDHFRGCGSLLLVQV